MLLKRAVLFMAVIAAVSVMVGASALGRSADPRKSHKVTGHGASAAIAGKGIPGVKGSTQKSAGEIKVKPGGTGGVLSKIVFDGGTASHGTTTVFLPLGSWGGPFTAKTTFNPDGSLTIVIHNKVTHGTGIYKGVTGNVTVVSHAATASATVHTFTVQGKIKY
jgi:hypothetical protein